MKSIRKKIVNEGPSTEYMVVQKASYIIMNISLAILLVTIAISLVV